MVEITKERLEELEKSERTVADIDLIMNDTVGEIETEEAVLDYVYNWFNK